MVPDYNRNRLVGSMQCNTTAGLRASATRAFLGPARFATANAQPLTERRQVTPSALKATAVPSWA
jgi:hypothetical protein